MLGCGRGGKLSKVVKGPRIRGHAFELKSGLWTYFIRVGDEKTDGREKTIHADHAWETKEEALAELQNQVNWVLEKTGALVVHEGGK